MSPSARADALVHAGRFAEAFDVLSRAAAGNDPQSLYVLAMWRISGQIIRRDLAASRDLFRRASQHGHDDAAKIHVNFVANGTGGRADWIEALALLNAMAVRGGDWPRRQLAVIAEMALNSEGYPQSTPECERLSERPDVTVYRSLLNPAECAFLIAEATPSFAPSVIIDPQTGAHVQNPIRTSDGTAFPFVQESPAIHAINRRIAAITETDVRAGEPLQILRYRPGQQFRPHFDAETGATNQRVITVLLYLNEDYGGGETEFVRTGLRFKGRPGDALVFRNALPNGQPDELTQHAGLPVTAGEKLIASRWIRQKPFLLEPPTPMIDA